MTNRIFRVDFSKARRCQYQTWARKRLDIERIGRIKAAARVFLTLHGGSGTNDDDLRNAIAAGINIVHINTELRVAWRRGLEDGLMKHPNEIVPYKILPAAVDAVKYVVSSRLKLFSEGGAHLLDSATRLAETTP